MAFDLEIVVSTEDGAFNATHITVGGATTTSRTTVYHHNSRARDKGGELAQTFSGDSATREAGTFLAHVTRRYDSLAGHTAFVHGDVALHNPVWARWLRCLRNNVSFASLSPTVFDGLPHERSASAGALSGALGIDAKMTLTPPATCCFLVVASREHLQSRARSRYVAAEALFDRRQHESAAVRRVVCKHRSSSNPTAFLHEGDIITSCHACASPTDDLENLAHGLRTNADWLNPCVNFRCEESACARYVRYMRTPRPFAHGISLATAHGPVLRWQENACGVRDRCDPEIRELRSVRELLHAPCGPSAMVTHLQVVHHSGCARKRGQRTRTTTGSYAAYAWRTDRRRRAARALGNSTPFAKAAVAIIKPSMCAGVVRCWNACCAACAERAWCVAWEWSLPDEHCALSAEQAQLRSGGGRTSTVVGGWWED